MLKKKCFSCGNKIERKFNYCPYCGVSFKVRDESENFGMLGRDDLSDSIPQKSPLAGLPFGLDKIAQSLIKQIEEQMAGMDSDVSNERKTNAPRGFKIQISTGVPQVKQMQPQIPNGGSANKINSPMKVQISREEFERRMKLPRVDATSKIRRIGDEIIYEIDVPGVKSEKDIAIARLEEGLEVKAYSKDNCYVKVIPLKVELMGYSLRDDTLFVELKG
ncbi:MAG: hypothetical protein WCP89_00550 [archaeon]